MLTRTCDNTGIPTELPRISAEQSVPAIRLAAIDLDGTLLTGRGEVSPANRAALQATVDRGVFLVICTGRGYFTSQQLLRTLPLNAPSVLQGGSLIYDFRSDAVVEFRNLEPADAWRAIEIIRGCKLVPIVYEPMPDGYHFCVDTIDPGNPALASYLSYSSDRAQRVDALETVVQTGPALIATVGRSDEIARLATTLRATVPSASVIEERNYLHEGYAQVYVHPPGCTKSQGLDRLAARLRIRREEILALGDNHNDLDLLRYAGLGIAMANAFDEVKAAADAVTLSCDEDGVAAALHRYVLND